MPLVHWLQKYQMLFYFRNPAETCGDEREIISSKMRMARGIINRGRNITLSLARCHTQLSKILEYDELKRKTPQVKAGDERWQ